MPVYSRTTRPACRLMRSSSEGRMNFRYSCVPRGSSLRMYSAPTMANSHDFGLRLSVGKNTRPRRCGRCPGGGRGIDLMHRPELAGRIPPTRGEPLEFGDLVGVDVCLGVC